MSILDSLKGIFGIGMNYRVELQKIVDEYPDLKDLQWAYGGFTDEHQGLTGRVYTLYNYIVLFGNNRLIIIPFQDKANKITPGDPIEVERTIVKAISFSKLIKSFNVTFNNGLKDIHFQVDPFNIKIPFKASINLKQKEQYTQYNNFIIPFVDSFNF